MPYYLHYFMCIVQGIEPGAVLMLSSTVELNCILSPFLLEIGSGDVA